MRLIPAALAASACVAHAHLAAGSLMPKGGATYHPGDVVTLTWGVEVPHNEGIDVAFSANGGRTWTTVKSNLADQAKSDAYKWTVPATMTTQGKLRICQTEKSPKCTDADSLNRPSGPAPYVLVSGIFSIAQATALSPASARLVSSPILLSTGAGAVDLDFDLAVAGPIRLIAYSADGRLAAVLLEGRYAAGSHRVSVYSERLRAHPEWKLRLE